MEEGVEKMKEDGWRRVERRKEEGWREERME